ncbi:MAG: hypothetical protein ILO68_01975, partial [Clostridia bacterium]|nr:hypothetical protein [Clostridia bacterium]
MADYSKQDLKYAAELREEVHKEALAIVRKTRPDASEVVDRHPVEDYFQEHWDYPGRWYTVVAIPYGYKSRNALIDEIVRNTLSGMTSGQELPDAPESMDGPPLVPGRRRLSDQLDGKPDGYEERFIVEIDQKSRRFRAVGEDSRGRHILEEFEEYSLNGVTRSASAYYLLTDPEYRRFARLAFLNGRLKEEDYERLTAEPSETLKQGKDPFYAVLSAYPDLVLDYRIVREESYCGYESHRRALKTAFCSLDGEWTGDPDRAAGKRVKGKDLFSSKSRHGKLSYRDAFLCPPYPAGYPDEDFDRVNAALFPKGTYGLEAYEWTTDWSDYF